MVEISQARISDSRVQKFDSKSEQKFGSNVEKSDKEER